MGVEGQRDQDGFWAIVAEGEQRIRETFPELPCFGLRDWDGGVMVGEWIFDGGPHGLLHGDPGLGSPYAQVLTTAHEVNQSIRTMRLGARAMVEDKDAYLRQLDELDRQEPRMVGIAVDGERVEFALWQDGDKWWAGAERGRYGIIIEASGLEAPAVALESVADIEPCLAARRTWLRQVRGEAG
jgi:hypothetical protein